MAAPWEKYSTPVASPFGNRPVIQQQPDPYRERDQQLQEEASQRAEEDQQFQREKLTRELAAKTKDPKVSEGERASAGFYRRAMNAHRLYGEGILPRNPVVQSVVDVLPDGWQNALSEPERRAAKNYADEFIRAKLRKESGAAISVPEMESEYNIYFPVPGDTRTDLDRKGKLREQAIEALGINAGDEKAHALEGIPPAGLQNEETPPPIGESIHPPTGPAAQITKGGTTLVPDETAAGLNAKVNALMKSGAGAKDILDAVKATGVPPREVMPSVMQAIAWRKQHPGYKGDWSVNFEQKTVQQNPVEKAISDVGFSPLGAGAVAAANTVTGNHLDNIVGMAGGDPNQANANSQALRQAYPGASFAGDLAGGASMALLAPGAAATGTLAPGALAGDALLGGYIGSGSDGTNPFSLGAAGKGSLAALAGGVAGRGAINTAGRALSPSGGALAPAYAEGVKPTLGQRMGGPFSRAEQAMASVPMVGGIQRGARNSAVQQWQAGAFNQALRHIGTQLPDNIKSGTPAHAYMQRSFNQAYDKARSGLTFRNDDEFIADFANVQKDMAGLSADAQRQFTNIINDGASRLRARGGELAGRDFQAVVGKIEGKVRKLRKNPQGDTELADVLEDLAGALDKGARRHSAPEAIARMDAADRGYVMAVLIENAAKGRGGEIGEFTGSDLKGAILNDSGRRSRGALRGAAPLQDYASAGERLGSSVPDSGTTERLLTTGAVGAGVMMKPIVLAPWVIDTLANLPGGKQAVNALLAPNRKALDPARQRLLERAHLGGLLAAPVAETVSQ